MRKPLIPVGLNPDEILEYMHSHGFKNRHSAVGPHLGMVITYFDLVNRQEEENNGAERRRAEALKDAVYQDRGAAENPSAVEDDSGRHGIQRQSSGVRDSVSVSNDAGSPSPSGADSNAVSGAESRRSDSDGNGAGRSGVRDEKPSPEAPLKDKLNYWRPRLMWREDD